MIEEFIEATRGPRVQARVVPEHAARYESMFRWVTRRLDSMIGSGQPADRLLVIYSHTGEAETVSLDGQRIVVFDQYLGQIMNRLNRLLFESAPVAEVDAYLCKLFALRLLCAGRPKEALEYATLYHAWSRRLTSSGFASSADRIMFTLVQECFVLAHEISHCVFRQEQEAVIKAMIGGPSPPASRRRSPTSCGLGGRVLLRAARTSRRRCPRSAGTSSGASRDCTTVELSGPELWPDGWRPKR